MSIPRFVHVTSTPQCTTLAGKTAIVTGASSGIGQETARQLLTLHVSALILAVRSVQKGEDVRKLLLSDGAVRANNPGAVVKVLEVDMNSYQSVQAFAANVYTECRDLDILILNAGMGGLKFELSPSGHELVTQVNYLSNAALLLSLLPWLEATAAKTKRPSRVTWVGSRQHARSSLAKSNPVPAESTVLGHFDRPANFHALDRYADSKMLCAMFMYELVKRVPRESIIINQVCPGMTATANGDVLALPLRVMWRAAHWALARSVEQAGWIVVHAAEVAGPESHGAFFNEKEMQPQDGFIASPRGQELQQKLWKETIEEIGGLGVDTTKIMGEK